MFCICFGAFGQLLKARPQGLGACLAVFSALAQPQCGRPSPRPAAPVGAFRVFLASGRLEKRRAGLVQAPAIDGHAGRPQFFAHLNAAMRRRLATACRGLAASAVLTAAAQAQDMDMADIPAGRFVMGACLPPSAQDLHRVQAAACSPHDHYALSEEGP